MSTTEFTAEELSYMEVVYPDGVTRTPEGQLVPLVTRAEAVALAHRFPTMLETPEVAKTGNAVDDDLRARYPTMFAGK